MKKFNVVVLLCLLVQSIAWAGPAHSLKNVVDEYRFALTVEWDQKDPDQLKKIKATFAQSLKELVEVDGLTAADLEVFLKANAKELQVDQTLIDSMKGANGKLDLDKANKVLSEKSADLYMQGSSWAPEDLIWPAIGILVLFEIVVLIITARDDKCPNPEYHPNDIPYPCIYE